jgi:hypothetical protein
VFNASGDGILNTPEFSRVARLLEGPVLQRGYSCVPKEAQNLAGQDLQVRGPVHKPGARV